MQQHPENPNQPVFDQTPPLMPQPPVPPRRLVRWNWRRVGCLILVGSVLLCGLIGVIGHAANKTYDATTITTQTTTSETHTQAVPTHKPQVVPTLHPTHKPQSTPAIEQQITQLAKGSMTFGQDIKTQYDAGDGTVVITETIGESWDNHAALVEIQNDCFNIQKVLWTSNLHSLTSVEVDVLGPLVDQYGRQSTGLSGSCTRSLDTAAQFQWDNLDYTQAWKVYDSTWLLPSLNS